MTPLHTYLCYSEFNHIIASIADMELLDTFDNFNYPDEIGPGAYDIHWPDIPTREHIVQLMKKAVERIPTPRQWAELIPSLTNIFLSAIALFQLK